MFLVTFPLFHIRYENYTDVKFKRKQAVITGTPVKMSAGLAYPFIQGDTYVLFYVDDGSLDKELQIWVYQRNEQDGSDKWTEMTTEALLSCGVPEDSDFQSKIMECAQKAFHLKK